MTGRTDAQRTALEQRLEHLSRATPPASLRRRVLSAVDDMLDGPPTTAASGQLGDSSPLTFPAVAAVCCCAVALAAMVTVMAVPAASTPHAAAALTLDERARIAGVSDEMLGSFAADGRAPEPVMRPPRATDGSARRDTLRALDGHRLLQETL
jgi:hypothetical protein